MKLVMIFIGIIVTIAMTSFLISKNNPDFNEKKPHHRPDGFVNRYQDKYEKKGLLKWQWERYKEGLPKQPQNPILGVSPNIELIHQKLNAMTWIGHSTLLIQIDGINILTDPHFTDRASPIRFLGPKRHQAPGVPLELLPKIDIILISHNHYDHLDKPSIQALLKKYPKVQFFVPLGVQYWFKNNILGSKIEGENKNITALDWDDSYVLKGQTADIVLYFLAVQHWSARASFDRCETLWGSWGMISPKMKVWFSGDLGYSKDTKDIGKKLGEIDIAAIAIGAYEPRWFMKEAHINPSEAIQVMKDVKAKTAIGIHWGTFENLSDEALDTPPKDLKEALRKHPNTDFRVLKHGETWVKP